MKKLSPSCKHHDDGQPCCGQKELEHPYTMCSPVRITIVRIQGTCCTHLSCVFSLSLSLMSPDVVAIDRVLGKRTLLSECLTHNAERNAAHDLASGHDCSSRSVHSCTRMATLLLHIINIPSPRMANDIHDCDRLRFIISRLFLLQGSRG